MSNWTEHLKRAREHHEAGRVAAAAAIYREVLEQEPNHADALHWLGLAELQDGKSALAAELIGRAVMANPNVPAYWHNYAEALIATKKFPQAIEAFRRVVELNPTQPEAHAAFGLALRRMNDQAGAIDALRAAIKSGGRTAELYRNLGEALAMVGKSEEALAAFREALAIDPNSAATHQAMGVLFGQAGAFDESIAHLQKALQLRPDYAQAHRGLGAVYQRTGKLDDAARAYEAAIAADPTILDIRMDFAALLEKQSKLDAAAQQYREILRQRPHLPDVQYHLAAITNDRFAPGRSPASYVTRYFNDYAKTFDEHLLKKLSYRGPELLFDAVCEVRGALLQKMDILDLGCGTGLSGAAFKRLANTLSGIDLAAAMIEEAKKRNIYDRLAVANIQTALTWMEDKFDLVLACDVLIYVGDLRNVFESTIPHLRPRGYFAFTIELADCKNYELRPTRRYVHSEPYIRELARQNKLSVAYMKQAVLRTEHEQPVQGLIVVLQK